MVFVLAAAAELDRDTPEGSLVEPLYDVMSDIVFG